MNKRIVTSSFLESVVSDGATIMIGGFGGAGFPFGLRDALGNVSASRLTIVSNNADFGVLAERRMISQIYTSYPVGPTSGPVLEAINSGFIKLRLTPQGTLIEQIRAAGVGLGGFLTATGVGSDFVGSDIKRYILNDREYLIYPALSADVALIRASMVDRYGNCYSAGTSLNFNLAMAMAARITIVETSSVVDVGLIPPESVHIPSAFISYIFPTMLSNYDGAQENA